MDKYEKYENILVKKNNTLSGAIDDSKSLY